LTPREYSEYKQKKQDSSTGETGMSLSKRFGYVIAISVLPESPAEKAGIHSGDIFESIAGFTTREMSVGQALNLLRGPAGSGVKVGVIRRGKAQPDEVDVVRQKLPAVKMIAQKTDPDILAMRVLTLDEGRAEEIRNRLIDADKQGAHKLILDLRDCGRGSVSEALAVARLFVPSGTLATLRGQTVSAETFSADASKVVWRNPVSVLIDGTTSGAAEVLASAILANHRGDLVGERTFGLASEQKLITLDDGSALFLTVANYYNPAGKAILEEGVTPSEVVRAAADQDNDVTDDSADSSGGKETSSSARPLSPEDPVFRRALDLLKAPAKKAA
jgi:carboxyl-terminal processing protease